MMFRPSGKLGRILLVASLTLFLAAIGLWIRSYFKFDAISRSNWTAQPLTAEARAYAKQRNFDPQFISRGEGFSAQVWRGRVTFVHGLQLDVTSRWDEAFEKQYVNKPQWSYSANAASDSTPPHGSGVLAWLGFSDDIVTFGGGWVKRYRYLTLP